MTAKRRLRRWAIGVGLTLLLLICLFCTSILVRTHGSDDSAILFRKAISLYLRIPTREAADAARRGDFRLGITRAFGPTGVNSELPGVTCDFWPIWYIGKTASSDDVIRAGERFHSAAALRFLTRYNRALVSQAGFPYPELCAPDDSKPAPRYTGAVRTFAEAARAGDLSAIRHLGAGHSSEIDRRDLLGYTALQWAMRDGHPAIARQLLLLGANPNLRAPDAYGVVSPDRGPSPLARALRSKDEGLVDLLIERGAQITGESGLCTYSRYGDDRACSWTSLVLTVKRFDLLPAALLADRSSQTEEDVGLPSTGFELIDAFDHAAASNPSFARFLIPFLDKDQRASRVLWLLAHGHDDLAFDVAIASHDKLGFTKAESSVWEEAAKHHQGQSLALLAEYGGELNLLPPPRLAACRRAAGSGAIALLVDCIKDAAGRESAIESAIDRGAADLLLALLRQAADLHVHGRAGIADLIAAKGTPAVARAVLPLMAPLDGTQNPPWRPAGGPYHNRNVASFSNWPGLGKLNQRLTLPPGPLETALKRDETSLILAVAAARPRDAGIKFAIRFEHMPGSFDEQNGIEHFADGPPEPSRAIALALIRSAAKVDDQKSLELMLRTLVGQGWDDLIKVVLDSGFHASQAHRPDRLWDAWTGLGMPCRPSTGALLIKAGVPIEYPLNPVLNGKPVSWILAAGCANSASARVLVAARPASLAYVTEDGSTLVDVAEDHQKTRMAAELRRLIASRGPAFVEGLARVRAERRKDIDWDLDQSSTVH